MCIIIFLCFCVALPLLFVVLCYVYWCACIRNTEQRNSVQTNVSAVYIMQTQKYNINTTLTTALLLVL